MTKAKEKRNFGLINEKGEEVGVFTGAQPRDAALKAAARNVIVITLREKGTKKLHYFIGKKLLVPAPKDAPAWIQNAAKKNNGNIYKACVKKYGTDKLVNNQLDKNPITLFQWAGHPYLDTRDFFCDTDLAGNSIEKPYANPRPGPSTQPDSTGTNNPGQ